MRAYQDTLLFFSDGQNRIIDFREILKSFGIHMAMLFSAANNSGPDADLTALADIVKQGFMSVDREIGDLEEFLKGLWACNE